VWNVGDIKGLAVDPAGRWVYTSGTSGLNRLAVQDLVQQRTATP